MYDHTMFFSFFQMLQTGFEELLQLIEKSIQKKDTNCRKALSPSLKLAYLATGESQTSLSFNFCVERSTVNSILNEVPPKYGKWSHSYLLKCPLLTQCGNHWQMTFGTYGVSHFA